MKDKMIVDTNIVVRMITKDHEEHAAHILEIVKKVDNDELILFMPSIVVAETCWVLKSVYKMDKLSYTQHLLNILNSDGVILEEDMCIAALKSHVENNVDYIDAYLSEKSKTISYPVLTWNAKDFRRLDCEYYIPSDLS